MNRHADRSSKVSRQVIQQGYVSSILTADQEHAWQLVLHGHKHVLFPQPVCLAKVQSMLQAKTKVVFEECGICLET